MNCTCIDWFHEWPHEALVSVSSKFLQEVQLLTPELRESVSSFVAYIHTSVNNMSQVYLEVSNCMYSNSCTSHNSLFLMVKNLRFFHMAMFLVLRSSVELSDKFLS